MIKKIVSLAAILSIIFIKSWSQDYLGLSTGNYSGIQGVMLQPANVADNRYQYEINLLSGSLNFSNNYLGISRDYFFKNKFSFEGFESFQDFRSRVLTRDNTIDEKAYLNLANRINLPSLLLSTGLNSGIAVNFQSRTGIAIKNMDIALANQLYSTWDDSSTYGQNYNTGGLDISGMNWLEFGLTYGRILINEDEHFLKAGVTAKYLGGISSMYFNADRLTVRADNDSTLYIQSNQINYGHSPTDISSGINSSFRPDASAFGFDIGLVYEFRGRIDKFKFLKYDDDKDRLKIAKRRDKNKYTFKVVVSLLDVGKFRFQSVPLARNFAIDDVINLNAIDIRSIRDFDNEVQQRGTYVSDSGSKYTVALPTAFSAQIDLHLYKGFYLNAMMYKPVSAFNYNADVRIYTPDYYAVTPRWESRVAGIYLPFVLSSKNEISAGATIRVGPVFVGTSNLLSFIEKDNIKAADVHAGLKIPIAFRKPGTSSALLRKIIADDDDLDTDMPDESLFLKDTVETKVPADSVKRNVPKEQPKHPAAPVQQLPAQQPINIIINNYNSPNSALPSSTQVYKLDSMNNTIPVNNVLQGSPVPAPAATDTHKLDLLQQQIDLLNKKLREKEALLKQLEQNSTGKEAGSDTDIKKKIPLMNKNLGSGFIPDTARGQNQASFSAESAYEQRLREMQATLDILNTRNDLLDKQLEYNLLAKDQQRPGKHADSTINSNVNAGKKSLAKDTILVNEPKLKTASTALLEKHDSVQLITNVVPHPAKDSTVKPAGNLLAAGKPQGNSESPDSASYYRKYLQLQEENKRLKTQVDNMQSPEPRPVASPATSPVLTGNTGSGNAASQDDINKLTSEVASLKQEIANAANNKGTPQEITVKKSPSLVPNIMPTVGIGLGGRNKTTVIHDTVYRDKAPAADTIIKYSTDTVVQVIRDTILQRDTIIHEVRDTVHNTVVKDSIVTKIKVVDSLQSNLLSMPPLVVLFDVGKYSLKMIYQKRLDYYAAQVKKAPGLMIAITGHADKTGSAAKNLILSQKRAATVTNYLLAKGLHRDQIAETALGEDAPVVTDETEAAQSQNRRVEVVFKEVEP